jgi:amino acid transporter
MNRGAPAAVERGPGARAAGEADPRPPAAPGAAPPDLRRVIGFWGGTALVIGLTIGSGIFRTPPTIAALVPDPRLVLGLWTLLGVISLCGALALAELASMLPRTGGIYVYLRLAYGDGAAFVVGWLYLLVTSPAAFAALATVFVEILLGTLGVPPGAAPAWLVPGGAVAVVAGLAAVNILGTRFGSAVQTTLTAIKVAALAGVIAVGFASAGGSFSHVAAPADAPIGGAALARAVAAIIWTYDGWVAISMIAGEVQAPERQVKRIIVAGMLAVGVLYLGANLAYAYALPPETLAREDAGMAVRLVGGALGPLGAAVMGLCIGASVLGTASGNVLAKPRVAYALARDGLALSALGRLHPTRGTPHVAIAVEAAVAALLIVTLRDFGTLTTYFVVVEWFALLFAVGAVFVLRRRLPEAPRPFRTPLYPWVPLVFVVGTAVGLAAIVWGAWSEGNRSPVYGLALAVAGFPAYAIYRRRREQNGSLVV